MAKEEDYVQALSKGDGRAFEFLFLQYQPKVVCFFAGFVHDKEQAEDLAQDLFFNLWKNRNKLSGVRSFSAYLYQMARNELYNYYDRSLVREKYDIEQLWAPLKTDTLEEQLFADELQALIDEWINKLPAQRQQVFRMSRFEGLSNEEIAAHFHISKRTVENHLSTALSELRKALKIFLFFLSL